MQGIKTEKDTISGLDVETTQFVPMRAHKLLAKLARVMGPVLGAIGNVELDQDGEVTNFNGASLGPALVSVFGAMDETIAERLPLEILAGTSVIRTMDDGNKKRFDVSSLAGYNDAFAGMGVAPYLVMAFALKVNFGRFLEDLAGLTPAVPKANPLTGPKS